jgi:enamine deaminase RidA (YjgF/YER057c/UK114 family)
LNEHEITSSKWPSCVTAGPFMFFSGQMGRAQNGSFITRYADAPDFGARANATFDWVSDMEAPVGAQGIAIYERYREMLAKEGSDIGHILRYHIYQRDKHFFSVFDRIRRTYETKPPASTAVGMGRFEPRDGATLCIDSIALRASGERILGARTVLPGAAQHVAAATFSHVVSAGLFLFLAGQIPIDTSKPGSPLIRNYEDIPEEGRFLRVGRSHEDTRNGPIAAQTWFTYDLIRQHLEAAGSSMDQILNLIVYLQDIRDFPTFHRVHERFFKSKPPALTVIEVREVGHKGTLIEIEPTAIVAGRGVERRIIEPKGWRAPAHMSAGVSADGLAFFSAVIGADESGRPVQLSESVRANLARPVSEQSNGSPYALQTAAAVSALTRRLAAADATLSNIAHLTVYVEDITQFAAVERAIEQGFGEWRPALTVLEVPAPAPVRGACVSLTAIAWLGEGKMSGAF